MPSRGNTKCCLYPPASRNGLLVLLLASIGVMPLRSSWGLFWLLLTFDLEMSPTSGLHHQGGESLVYPASCIDQVREEAALPQLGDGQTETVHLVVSSRWR